MPVQLLSLGLAIVGLLVNMGAAWWLIRIDPKDERFSVVTTSLGGVGKAHGVEGLLHGQRRAAVAVFFGTGLQVVAVVLQASR